MTIFESCTAAHGNNTLLVVKCVSNWMETESSQLKTTRSDGDDVVVTLSEVYSWLLVLCGALVFFMQAGFAMVCAGAIRKKNVNNTMIKNLLDACGAGMSFCVFGYAISFGHSGDATSTFFGNDNFFMMGHDIDPAFFFFQYAFSAAAVTIVAGTLAERCRMAAYVAYSIFLTGFVYPTVVHNFWSNQGYFSPGNPDALVGTGMIDFAGSGVVHLTGGITALYAAFILGARRGRFHDKEGKPLARLGLTKGHSVSLQMLGTMILWFCWYGFNCGSALLLVGKEKGTIAAVAAVNTTLSAAAATLSALCTNAILAKRRTGEFTLDITMAMNGCLSGLVAITAGCGVVEYGLAVVTGIVAGWVYIIADAELIRWKVDDAVSAIPVHMANGLWGIIAVGLFASPDRLLAAFGTSSHPGWFYAPASQNLLPAQLVGAGFILGWTFVTMVPFFLALDYMGWFRVNELEELVGLDVNYGDTQHLDEGSSSGNLEETLRRAAYRRRYEEKRQLRESNEVVQPMTVKEFLGDYIRRTEREAAEREETRQRDEKKKLGKKTKSKRHMNTTGTTENNGLVATTSMHRSDHNHGGGAQSGGGEEDDIERLEL